jgi:hypothetical protein
MVRRCVLWVGARQRCERHGACSRSSAPCARHAHTHTHTHNRTTTHKRTLTAHASLHTAAAQQRSTRQRRPPAHPDALRARVQLLPQVKQQPRRDLQALGHAERRHCEQLAHVPDALRGAADVAREQRHGAQQLRPAGRRARGQRAWLAQGAAGAKGRAARAQQRRARHAQRRAQRSCSRPFTTLRHTPAPPPP